MTETKKIKNYNMRHKKIKSSLNDMEKVKIKRVKRQHKKISTQEKILAGIGVGSTLLGGAGVVAPKTGQTQFVRTMDKQSAGKTTGRIKSLLKNVFGIKGAAAATPEETRDAALAEAQATKDQRMSDLDTWRTQADADADAWLAQDPENPDAQKRKADIQTAYDEEVQNITDSYNAAVVTIQQAYQQAIAQQGPQVGEERTNAEGFTEVYDGSGWRLKDGQTKVILGIVYTTQNGVWVEQQQGGQTQAPKEGDTKTENDLTYTYKNGQWVMDAGQRVQNPNTFWYLSDGQGGWTLEDGQTKTEGGIIYKSQGGEWVEQQQQQGPQVGEERTNAEGFTEVYDGSGWRLKDGQEKVIMGTVYVTQNGVWVEQQSSGGAVAHTYTITTGAPAVSVDVNSGAGMTYEIRDETGQLVNMAVGVGPSFSVSNPSVARVNAVPGTVEIIGVSEGTATVTINYAGASATFEVTVNALPGSGDQGGGGAVAHTYTITTGASSVSVDAGSGAGMTYEIRDETGQLVNMAVGVGPSFSVSNPSVARVNAVPGTVEIIGVSEGTATVTINYAGASATFEVTVNALPGSGDQGGGGAVAHTYTITTGAPAVSVDVNSGAGMTYEIRDETGQLVNMAVGVGPSFSVSNPSVARVNAVPGTVEIIGVSEGTATVTINYAGASATFEVTVNALPGSGDQGGGGAGGAAALNISVPSISGVTAGQYQEFPFQATGGSGGYVWEKVSGPDWLLMDPNTGILYTENMPADLITGTVSVTVRVSDGSASAQKVFSISVYAPAQGGQTSGFSVSASQGTLSARSGNYTEFANVLQVSGGGGSYAYSIAMADGSMLPAGIGIGETGIIYANDNTFGQAPVPAGSYMLTVGVVDLGSGETKNIILNLQVQPSGTQTPPSQTAVSVNFSKADGSSAANLKVGDAWKISITGAKPGVQVAARVTYQLAGQSAPVTATEELGVVGEDGSFEITRQVSTENIGSWAVMFLVDGQTAATSAFNVIAQTGSATAVGQVAFTKADGSLATILKVGDTWKIVIIGATANAQVVAGTEQILASGQKAVGTRILGTTDAQGRLQVTDTVLAENVGNWTMRIKVGGQDMGFVANYRVTREGPYDENHILRPGWTLVTLDKYYNASLGIYSSADGAAQATDSQAFDNMLVRYKLGLSGSAPIYFGNVYVYNSFDGTFQLINQSNYATLDIAQRMATLLGGTVETSYFRGGPFVNVLGQKVPTSQADWAPMYSIKAGNYVFGAGGLAQIMINYNYTFEQAVNWHKGIDRANADGASGGAATTAAAGATTGGATQTQSAVPVITALSTASVAQNLLSQNYRVAIVGSNFNSVLSQNLVEIVDGKGAVRQIIPNQVLAQGMIFTLPANLAVGSYKIQVRNLADPIKLVSTRLNFTVTAGAAASSNESDDLILDESEYSGAGGGSSSNTKGAGSNTDGGGGTSGGGSNTGGGSGSGARGGGSNTGGNDGTGGGGSNTGGGGTRGSAGGSNAGGGGGSNTGGGGTSGGGINIMGSVDGHPFQGLRMPTGLQYQAPEEEAQVQGAATVGTYTVEKGDSLWKIAKKHYGDGKKWRKILEANTDKVKNPKSLGIGTVLVIPKI